MSHRFASKKRSFDAEASNERVHYANTNRLIRTMAFQTLAYFNGQFVAAADVRLSLGDAGFVWGATITDRLRTFGGKLFRLEEHLKRFRESCRLARIRLNETDEHIVAVSNRLVAANKHTFDLSLVWLATPGRSTGFASDTDSRIPTFIAYTQDLTSLKTKKLGRDGAQLRSWPVLLGMDPRIKHRSRLQWWMAAQEVHDADRHAEPLFVDHSTGHVLETPTANIVAVIDGVVTAPLAGTILHGVSLGVVQELCAELNMPFAEGPITIADLERASEILLTNTSFCVVGVSRVNGRPIPFPGSILNQLVDAWSKLVGVPIRL